MDINHTPRDEIRCRFSRAILMVLYPSLYVADTEMCSHAQQVVYVTAECKVDWILFLPPSCLGHLISGKRRKAWNPLCSEHCVFPTASEDSPSSLATNRSSFRNPVCFSGFYHKSQHQTTHSQHLQALWVKPCAY